MTSLSQIRIVLSHPSHPGNIGSTARAMKTMGFSRLVLVNPSVYPDSRAVAMAAGADDVLAAATVVPTLEEALADCQIVIGTSARIRELPLPVLDPRVAAEKIAASPPGTEIALLFGRERIGLTNEELDACHYQVIIPANPDYASLNLAQAVQLLCYECRYRLTSQPPMVTAHDSLATVAALQHLHEHMEEVVTQIGFYDPRRSKRLLPRLRRLFTRVQLEKTEVQILRGCLALIQRLTQEPRE